MADGKHRSDYAPDGEIIRDVANVNVDHTTDHPVHGAYAMVHCLPWRFVPLFCFRIIFQRFVASLLSVPENRLLALNETRNRSIVCVPLAHHKFSLASIMFVQLLFVSWSLWYVNWLAIFKNE